MDEPLLREPEQIRADCARKLRPIETGGMFTAILATLLGEDWTEPRIEELFVTPDRHLLARTSGDVSHRQYLGVEADLIRIIHGIAEVARLDGDELGYLLGICRRRSGSSSQDEAMSFPPEVCDKLGYYVYAYLDPRNPRVFYIGKGKDNRAFEHLYDTSETKKVTRIADIKSAELLPTIDILVHGLTEQEALRVEAVCIDLIGLDRLTNLVTGHGAAWGGRQPVDQIIEQFTAQQAHVTDPAIGITINRTFAYGMPDEALYEATRGVWVINRQRAEQAHYALAVYHGVVKEVYEVRSWHPAGTTRYHTRTFDEDDFEGRSEFVGGIAPQAVRERYMGKRVMDGGKQNPIRYFNC